MILVFPMGVPLHSTLHPCGISATPFKCFAELLACTQTPIGSTVTLILVLIYTPLMHPVHHKVLLLHHRLLAATPMFTMDELYFEETITYAHTK